MKTLLCFWGLILGFTLILPGQQFDQDTAIANQLIREIDPLINQQEDTLVLTHARKAKALYLRHEMYEGALLAAYYEGVVKNFRQDSTFSSYTDSLFRSADSQLESPNGVLARIVLLKGLDYYFQTHFDSAEKLVLRAYSIQKQLGPSFQLEQLSSLEYLIRIQMNLYNDIDSALFWAYRAERIMLHHQDRPQENFLTIYKMMADLMNRKGDGHGSVKYYKKAMAIGIKLLKSHDHPMLTSIYEGIGEAYMYLGIPDSARPYLFRSFQIWNNLSQEFSIDQIRIYFALGSYYRSIKQPDSAILFYRKLDDHRSLYIGSNASINALLDFNFGGTYYTMGHYPEAITYLDASRNEQEAILKTGILWGNNISSQYTNSLLTTGTITKCRGLSNAGENIYRINSRKKSLRSFPASESPRKYSPT